MVLNSIQPVISGVTVGGAAGMPSSPTSTSASSWAIPLQMGRQGKSNLFNLAIHHHD
jgi:hypothetical protein